MRTTTVVTQMVMRLLGLTLIVLGLLFWSGHALQLVNLHMAVGVLFVLSIWVLAGLAAKMHQSSGFIALAVVWGLIVLALGMAQRGLVPGSLHWMIRVLHLLVGLAAMGIGENLAKRTLAATSISPVGA